MSREQALMILDSEGKCQWFHGAPSVSGTMKISLARLELSDQASDVVPQLLTEGWQPVRETGMGDGSVLILWEKSRT